MALRVLAGKLGASPAREAAFRAFSHTCEHCGKTSSRIADSLGQKNGAIKDELRRLDMEEFERRLNRKHYTIRALSAVASLCFVGTTVKYGFDLLEIAEDIRRRK